MLKSVLGWLSRHFCSYKNDCGCLFYFLVLNTLLVTKSTPTLWYCMICTVCVVVIYVWCRIFKIVVLLNVHKKESDFVKHVNHVLSVRNLLFVRFLFIQSYSVHQQSNNIITFNNIITYTITLRDSRFYKKLGQELLFSRRVAQRFARKTVSDGGVALTGNQPQKVRQFISIISSCQLVMTSKNKHTDWTQPKGGAE